MDKDSRITCSCGAPATDRSGDTAGAPICDKYPHCIPSSRGTAPNSHPQDGGPREIVWDGSPSPQPPQEKLADAVRDIQRELLELSSHNYKLDGTKVAALLGNALAVYSHAYAGERVGELEAQLAQWKTWGIIEVAVRNPQVAEYCDHWEKRTEQAEREREELRNALTNLLKALRPELTGHPKNVPKSSYAAQWDEAERLIR